MNLMNNLQEEKNGSQPTATPLAASADSHQPVSFNNQEIADEKNDPEVQLISGLDFDANEIALDLPAEGSVLVVDT